MGNGRTRTWRAGLVLALLSLAAPPGGAGQEAIDVSALGPQVGEQAPEFALPDQHGVSRPLRSLVGPKGLVLVFNRSADW